MALSSSRLQQMVALVEHGSIGKAAARIGISQPALTKSIQTLEAALGVRLFDRHARGVAPTEFGRLVLAHAEGLAAREGDLLREIRLLAGIEVGQVDVALGPYPSVLSGYAAAGRLAAAHPRLRIGLHVDDWRGVTRAVAQRRVELGIAELSDAMLDDELDTQPLAQHRGRLFCRPGHPLQSTPRLAWSDLLGYPWAHTRVPSRIAAAFPRHPVPAGRFDEATGDFVPAIEISVPMGLAQLVGHSDVLTFATFAIVERDLDSGRLAYLPMPDLDWRTNYGFIFRRGRSLSSAAQAFMQAMREEEQCVAEREAQLELRYGDRPPRPAGVGRNGRNLGR
jgi:DNA-binding transcriptional LysR family regulator